MKALIEQRINEALAQIAQIKILLSHPQRLKASYRIRTESDYVKFWDGYLTALEILKEDLE